jgi:transglutaminase-like putative cysteine protease
VIHRLSLAAVLLLVGALLPLSALAQSERDRPTPPGATPPPDAFARLEAAGDAAAHPEHDHVIVRDVVTNEVTGQGISYLDQYVLHKVLTEAGCRELAVLRWDYDPRSSFVDVAEVAVLRDGERIPVPVDAVHDLPAPQAAIYWRNRIQLLQLPRLQVGDGIEVRTHRKGYSYALLREPVPPIEPTARVAISEPGDDRYVPPDPGQYFDIVIFPAPVPVLEKRYQITLPADKRLHSQVYNGALYSSTTYDEAATTYAWWARDIAPLPREPRGADPSDVAAKVVLATAESWEAKSRWFFDVNRDQFESTPEIDAKVQEILEEAGVEGGTEDEQAKALLHWVAQNIRYSGQTMGEGEGFTLHPGEMIFRQRSGVCKDIAGMLVTMMRAAGMDANPAMTMAGSRIEKVPADQFNHCVVARRVEDDWVMYDPTWVPFNNDIWSKLETEQHYLVGSSAGEDLTSIRYSPAEESPLRVRHAAKLDEQGGLSGTIRLEGEGAMDGRLRRLVAGAPVGRLDEQVLKLLDPMPGTVTQLRVRHRQPDDFTGEMWIELAYTAQDAALPVVDGLELAPPALAALVESGNLFRAAATKWPAPDERQTDVMLWYTMLADVNERIELPRGWRLVDAPAPEPVDAPYASFAADAVQDDGALVLETKASVRRRQIPPDGYAGLREAMEAVRTWAGTGVRVGAGGER